VLLQEEKEDAGG